MVTLQGNKLSEVLELLKTQINQTHPLFWEHTEFNPSSNLQFVFNPQDPSATWALQQNLLCNLSTCNLDVTKAIGGRQRGTSFDK